ncbi:MAG: hypothetical protein JO306_00280 [Gemmatimonadetes bacterium]|nr:hypothetical protein [Gemmatimonadota bacterium]
MPRPWFRMLVPAALALAAAACTESLVISDPPAEDSPLFEVEYQNYAWGPQWNGFYVDRQGRVYRYNLGASRNSAYADSVMTPQQLAAKYDNMRMLVKTLSAGEASSKYELVPQAAAGSYTDQQGVCADAGGERYSAWIYEESDGKYHRLLLHLRGDIAQANRSAAAKALFHWLEGVTGTAAEGCDPSE